MKSQIILGLISISLVCHAQVGVTINSGSGVLSAQSATSSASVADFENEDIDVLMIPPADAEKLKRLDDAAKAAAAELDSFKKDVENRLEAAWDMHKREEKQLALSKGSISVDNFYPGAYLIANMFVFSSDFTFARHQRDYNLTVATWTSPYVASGPTQVSTEIRQLTLREASTGRALKLDKDEADTAEADWETSIRKKYKLSGKIEFSRDRTLALTGEHEISHCYGGPLRN